MLSLLKNKCNFEKHCNKYYFIIRFTFHFYFIPALSPFYQLFYFVAFYHETYLIQEASKKSFGDKRHVKQLTLTVLYVKKYARRQLKLHKPL